MCNKYSLYRCLYILLFTLFSTKCIPYVYDASVFALPVFCILLNIFVLSICFCDSSELSNTLISDCAFQIYTILVTYKVCFISIMTLFSCSSSLSSTNIHFLLDVSYFSKPFELFFRENIAIFKKYIGLLSFYILGNPFLAYFLWYIF